MSIGDLTKNDSLQCIFSLKNKVSKNGPSRDGCAAERMRSCG